MRLIQGGIVGITIGVWAMGSSAIAQIVPDGTLGVERSTITPDLVNPNLIQIGGGAQRQSNLFHSFNQFNITNRQGIYFDNPVGVRNIFARVTGTSRSDIQGTLGVDGNANLFLINPNGVLFGPRARLDLGGSFVTTTANAIQFGSQGLFSASNPEAVPLLTINPSALVFNQSQSTVIPAIQLDRARLIVDPEQSLGLIGGDIKIDGGQLESDCGTIELGGLSGAGIVGLMNNAQGLQLSFPMDVPRADVKLQNDSRVYTFNGGGLAFHARNVSLDGDSYLATLVSAGQRDVNRPAGNIDVDITETLNLTGRSFIVSQGLIDSGNVAIKAQAISLTNSEMSTSGQQNAGNITLNVSQRMSLNASRISSSGGLGRIGNSGDIKITAGSINLANGSILNSAPDKQVKNGNAGNIILNAVAAVSLDASLINSSGGLGGIGNSGNVRITADTINIINISGLDASTYRQGSAGKITLQARGDISLLGQGSIASTSRAKAYGATNTSIGGGIEIRARSLSLPGDGSVITSETLDKAPSSNISIITDDSINLIGTSIISSRSLGAEAGAAGNIQLRTRSLSLFDGGQIITSPTNGSSANAGDLQIRADKIEIKGSQENQSGLFSSSYGIGNAGQIVIDTRQLNLSDGGSINAQAKPSGQILDRSLDFQGYGRGGDIIIRATESVDVAGISATGRLSRITTTSRGSSDSGNVSITTRRFSLRDGGFVFTGTAEDSSGRGGNLTITATESTELSSATPDDMFRSNLSTFTSGSGDAGNLTFNTPRLSILGNVSVDSGTGLGSSGRGGNIVINAPDFVEVLGRFNPGSAATISSATGGSGKAGDITINTRRLSVRELGSINTISAKSDVGQGGNLTINAADSVEVLGNTLDGASISAVSNSTYNGRNAGQLTIKTGLLSVREGGVIQSQTFGAGQGGKIVIIAKDVEVIGGVVRGVNNQDNLSSILASTASSGSAGSLNISADRVTVSGNGAITSSTSLGSTGNGGNATIIATDTVELSSDVSRLSVRSSGTGAGGNLAVTSPRLILRNRATITAESRAADGGNIILTTSDYLLLRSGSKVTASAGTANLGGNGGNITLNSRFIVAVPQENSDIRANAFSGTGGNLSIATQGLFGITPLSRPNNKLSDITASSDLGVQGTVAINQPNIRPEQGLNELPTGLIDPTSRISKECPRGYTNQPMGRFVITGKGGLPTNPIDGSINTPTLPPLISTHENSPNVSADRQPLKEYTPIVEAQGFSRDLDGQVQLVAQTPGRNMPIVEIHCYANK
jgi:filamentous hemagglutinin family protein